MMTPDDQPYCGVELLPHATWPDGSPAPLLCSRQLHGRDSMHCNDEHGTQWQWQDAEGNWHYQRYRRRGTTAQRGYGGDHQKLRASWKPYVDAGMVECHAAVCLEERAGNGRWITPGSKWHLGHTADRTAWTGPEHARCNLYERNVRIAGHQPVRRSRIW